MALRFRQFLASLLLVGTLAAALVGAGAVHARIVPGEALWQSYLLAGGDPTDLCGNAMEPHGDHCQWCRTDGAALGVAPPLPMARLLVVAAFRPVQPEALPALRRHGPAPPARAPPSFPDLQLS